MILQMHLLPGATLIFGNNTALRFGGAIGVENLRSENEISASLNDFCFIQYNIGSENEHKPDNWKVICTLSYVYLYATGVQPL